MGDTIIRPSVEPTCGNCKFARPFKEHPQDIAPHPGAIECHGVPPTPVVMGQGPGGVATGLLRARLPKTDEACALWALKLAVAV